MQYVINHYNEADKDQLIAAEDQLRRDDGSYGADYDMSREATKATHDAMKADVRDGGGLYVARNNNHVIGFISLAVTTKNDPLLTGTTKALCVNDVFVALTYRSKGVGAALIQAAEQFARDNKLRYIKLGVYRANESTRRLYKREGFSDYDITMLKDIGSSS